MRYESREEIGAVVDKYEGCVFALSEDGVKLEIEKLKEVYKKTVEIKPVKKDKITGVFSAKYERRV